MNIYDHVDIIDQTFGEKPEVSVWCITYNHKDYIEDAFKSFLSQKTDFKYEIVVFDDASCDGTTEIVKGYAEEYPELFKLAVAKKNIYNNSDLRDKVIIWLKQHLVLGKYVAICEGDDMWTDPQKISLQRAFMENHPGYSMLCHASLWEECSSGKEKEFHPYSSSKELTPYEVIVKPGGNVSMASSFLRKEFFVLPKDFPKANIGDIRNQLNALINGKIYYDDRAMCRYRSCVSGSWTEKYRDDIEFRLRHNLEMMRFYTEYYHYTKGRYDNEINECLYKFRLSVRADRRNLGWERFMSICNEFESQDYLIPYLKEQEKQYLLEYGNYRMTNEEKAYIDSFRYRYIYGNGNFSRKVKVLLKNNGISCNGIVVTDGREVEGINKISDISRNSKDTLIIVGTDVGYEKEITDTLVCYGMNNFIAPFWIEKKIIS